MENQNKPEQRVIISTRKDGYSPRQIRKTMNVGELKALLEEFNDDSPIYLSFDNGYTYGGLSRHDIEEDYIPTDEDEDNE